MIIVITRHSENESNIEGFFFQHSPTELTSANAEFSAAVTYELYLSGELDMPIADLPRNVAHWESLGWTVHDIRDLAEPELDDDGPADLLPGEDMDGDHDSAMASAGFGTDEDYGYFGDGE